MGLGLGSPTGDGGGSGSEKDEIAHGSSFVGRHLEMHAVIHAVLSSHLTAVYGAKGLGKSALVLEVAPPLLST